VAAFDGATGPDGLVDLDRARRVAEDCRWTLGGLCDFYVRTTEEQLASLETAIARRSREEIRRLAHSLVGASASCGVDGMSRIMRRIEDLAEDGLIDDACNLAEEASRVFDATKRILSAACEQEPEPG